MSTSLITEQPKLSTDRASIYFALFYSIVNYFDFASHFGLRTSITCFEFSREVSKSMDKAGEQYSWKIRISISS